MSGSPVRSLEGVAKYTVLLAVDIVVLIESEPTSSSQHDEQFWKAIFSHLAPHKKVHFVPCGGKGNLNKYAEELRGKLTLPVVIARDRDFDHVLDKKNTVHHPRVISTYGYSWENDIFLNCKVIGGFFNKIHPGIKNIFKDIRAFKSCLDKELYWSTVCDFILRVRGRALFRTTNPGVLPSSLKERPTFQKQSILNLAQVEKRSANRNKIPKLKCKLNASKDCRGHFVAHYWYHVFRYVRFSGGVDCKLEKREFFAECINGFSNLLIYDKRKRYIQHYSRSISKAIIGL